VKYGKLLSIVHERELKLRLENNQVYKVWRLHRISRFLMFDNWNQKKEWQISFQQNKFRFTDDKSFVVFDIDHEKYFSRYLHPVVTRFSSESIHFHEILLQIVLDYINPAKILFFESFILFFNRIPADHHFDTIEHKVRSL